MSVTVAAPATVRFSDVDEFLEELSNDYVAIERGILRATRLWKASASSPAIQHVFVVATAIVGGHIVRFERYFGDDWGERFDGPSRQAMLDRSEATLKRLQEFAEKRSLRLRAGIFEEATA